MWLLWIILFPLCKCEIINLKVIKNVSLVSQVVIFTEDIQFINDGLNSVNEYTYVLDPNIEKARLKFSTENIQFDNRTYLIKLPKPLLQNEKFRFDVVVVVLDEIIILNSYNRQRLIKYKGNEKYFSNYKTKMYSVSYDLMEKSEFIQSEPHLNGNSTYLHNLIGNIEPFANYPLHLIYENNLPFYYVTSLERKIDISHFGFIVVEDRVAVMNKGPTSKQSYQSVPSYTRTKLRTLLPELAFNIKLFDEIGNNSKSILYDTGYGNLLLFETRYELFMTWKTVYTLQYTVPAYQYLSRSNDVYVLDMPLVDDVLPYALIKDSKTKVYLPTDSYLLMVNISEDHIKTSGREIVTTALAPSREVAVLYGMDLVNGMIPNFRLVYKRGTIHMFKPALYIIIYIQSIFLFYIFVSYLKPVVVLNKC